MQGVLSRQGEAFWVDLAGDRDLLYLARRLVIADGVDGGCLSGIE
jgi:hypothetical protein